MPPLSRWYFIVVLCLLLSGCGKSQNNCDGQVQKGDPAHRNGTATVRKAYEPQSDDPATTNDESNDQPLGHFGSVTLYAYNSSSGNVYTLDADVEAGEVQRLYFPKGVGLISTQAKSIVLETAVAQMKTGDTGSLEDSRPVRLNQKMKTLMTRTNPKKGYRTKPLASHLDRKQ